jgi:hypothetical protein
MYFHYKPSADITDRSGYYNSKIEMMLSQNRGFNSKKLLHKQPKPTTAASVAVAHRKISVGSGGN